MNHTDDDQFQLNGKDAHAIGVLTDHGFVVRAGAVARKDIVPSAADTVTPIRKRLLAEGVLVDDGQGLRFTQDYRFESPSGAAAAVMGRTANGWIEWKRSDGQTLSKVKRVARNAQEPLLTEVERQRILEQHGQLTKSGKLLSPRQLEQQYALFRNHFGPDALRGLDGGALLNLMHDHGNHDSLVYWLEFKNDEEFHGREFGSIAGGSALKFRVFRRKETGNWQAADKGNVPQDISTEEAIEMARTHRDQLLMGVELLRALPPDASDEDYAQLQDEMDELAPDVSRLAWGHKYFALMFPDKLDDFHSPDWQRFHLLKLLQLPPEGDGRYICAGRFVAAAKEVNLPMNHFTASLNAVVGGLHRYWRINTRTAEAPNSRWQLMRSGPCVAIGWPRLGDLSWIDDTKASRDKLRTVFREKYPDQESATGSVVAQIIQFVAAMNEGDVVLAADGGKILGIGKVTGDYRMVPGADLPNQRPVEWLDEDEWELPLSEGPQATVRRIQKHDENILEIERRIQKGVEWRRKVRSADSAIKPVRLNGVAGRIQSVLDRKSQAILYGPPGTGKTYWAERTAKDLAALAAFGKVFEALNDSEQQRVVGQTGSFVRVCCFHPAYGYEDFLEGYRPETINGNVSFDLRNGVFKSLCHDAEKAPQHNFYLIVDEINRGDIPRIFGELLSTLEKDKRGKRIILPLSQEAFSIPPNVFMIGTMNTADRSISLVDTALRRRFGFIELMPDGSLLGDGVVQGIPLRSWFEALNKRIRENVGRDARNLQIGHSYLMQSGVPIKDFAVLKRAIRDDVIPLLEEYCYEKYDTLGTILGDQLVDVAGECLHQELFDDGKETELVQALLAASPDISASSGALTTEQSHIELADEDTGEP